jgi:hypothetical protein
MKKITKKILIAFLAALIALGICSAVCLFAHVVFYLVFENPVTLLIVSFLLVTAGVFGIICDLWEDEQSKEGEG